MADSVALLFATNLATIGGHVAEMISIFVYPVIGYFWTRRRRRSSSVDFNIVEELPRSVVPVEDATNVIDSLAKCIASLVLVLQALEGLTADEALPKIHKGRERFDGLMQEYREIQQGVLALMEQLSDKTLRPDDAIASRGALNLSQSIRLLQLKGEMLSVEIRQMKIAYSQSGNAATSVAEDIDIERGLRAPLPHAPEVDARLHKATMNDTVAGVEHVVNDKSDPSCLQDVRADVSSFGNISTPTSELSILPIGLVDSCWEDDIDEVPPRSNFQKRTCTIRGLKVSRI